MGGEGSGFEEYKPNPVITKMFKIVAHVINETIPAFEKEYATGLAKDEFFQKIVKFIAEEGVKLGKNVTEKQVARTILIRFMGYLKTEIKEFKEHLAMQMQGDTTLMQYAAFLKQANKQAKENRKRGVDIKEFINVDAIRAGILRQLGEASKGLWAGFAKSYFHDMYTDPKTAQMLILYSNATGEDLEQFKKAFYQNAEKGFVASIMLFNHIFTEKFSANEDANMIFEKLVTAMQNNPDVVDFIKPRAMMLKALEKVLDHTTMKFKKGLEAFHEKDEKTKAFIKLVVAELKKEGKDKSEKELGDRKSVV